MRDREIATSASAPGEARLRLVQLPPLARYGVAVGAAALAILARLALEPIWGPRVPFLFFFPAIMISAWLGGLWPGITTTLLTAAASGYLWLAPARSWRIAEAADLLALLVFLGSGVLISGLNEAWRRVTDRAAANGRQLRLALEAGHMGTWEYELDGGRVRWSPALAAIHGLAPGEFPGTFEAFQQEIHPADRDRVLAAIGEATEQRRDHHVEYRIVRADGAVRWVEGRGQLLLDPQGRPQRMVGVCMDVTERKVQEEQFQLAVEASPSAMMIFDQRGAVVYANRLAEQLLGYTRQELIGQPVEILVPPGVREAHAGYRRAFLAKPQRRPMGAGRELFALRRDGTEVPVEIGLSPFSTGDGAFVLAAVTDISERRRAEADRAALLALEREDARRKDEFLAILSHELRNPLASLHNAAHILAISGPDQEAVQAAQQVLDRQLRHMVRLVDDLLDLSRIRQDRLALRKDRLPLSMIIEAALEASRPLIEERRHQLTTCLPADTLWVDADPVKLAQVFTNILNNAAKYTPAGGRIELAAELRGGEAVVRVRDNGAGMTPETLARLFEMFYRGDAAGQTTGGLGIGLALAKRLVDLHGGALAAHSAGPHQGSEIVATLPAAAAPAHRPPPAPAARAVTLSRRIVVADDETDAAELLATLLRLDGHEVRAVYDGIAACEAASEFQPEVMLLDISMPGLDGYEAARRIRQQPGGCDMVLVAITGWGQDEDRRRAEEAGFSAHFTKPVDPFLLRRLLSSPLLNDPGKPAAEIP